MTVANVPASGEQWTLLRDIGPDTYQKLLADHANRSSPRFTYDQGMLQIMTPLWTHEEYSRAVDTIVETYAFARGINVKSLGSTTYRLGKLKGFEPDNSFYLGDLPPVGRDQPMDLHVVRQPDLVVEIELTNPLMPKLPLLAEARVAEVWTYDGRAAHILVLNERLPPTYEASATSHALPEIAADALTGLLERLETTEWLTWMRSVREWAER